MTIAHRHGNIINVLKIFYVIFCQLNIRTVKTRQTLVYYSFQNNQLLTEVKVQNNTQLFRVMHTKLCH